MLALDHIQRISSNRGGVKRVDLIFEKDIDSMPAYDAASQYYTGSLSLVAGAQAYAIYFTKSTIRFQEQADIRSGHGDHYQVSLSGTVPKDRPLTRQFRQRLQNLRMALVFQDWNGYFRIARNMRAQPTARTNTFGSLNGMDLSFVGRSDRPLGFWEFVGGGAISTESQTCPVVTLDEFIIGDPEADQMIGDPSTGDVIGWFS